MIYSLCYNEMSEWQPKVVSAMFAWPPSSVAPLLMRMASIASLNCRPVFVSLKQTPAPGRDATLSNLRRLLLLLRRQMWPSDPPSHLTFVTILLLLSPTQCLWMLKVVDRPGRRKKWRFLVIKQKTTTSMWPSFFFFVSTSHTAAIYTRRNKGHSSCASDFSIFSPSLSAAAGTWTAVGR